MKLAAAHGRAHTGERRPRCGPTVEANVRSPHEDALPVIITHGWPGSIFELLKIVEPLTDPPEAEDAFHVVIPSLPGYGFSGRPEAPGWNPDRIARAWDELMKRLGYEHYVAQGGDWGAVITETMGRQAPSGLRGIHVNLPGERAIESSQIVNHFAFALLSSGASRLAAR